MDPMTELESRSSHVSVIIAPIFLGMDLVRELSQEDNTVNIISATMSIGKQCNYSLSHSETVERYPFCALPILSRKKVEQSSTLFTSNEFWHFPRRNA
jgi:hypothetical protein